MPVPRQIPYGHRIWWLCRLRGASILPNTSWCRYKILLALWDVVIIIHVNNISIRTIQSRRRTPTPQVSLQLRQEIDRCKCPLMDAIKKFQHHRLSIWTPIFKWISRTHTAYYNPIGASIYHRKASRLRILVLCVTTCSNDAESSPWPTRPHTNDTILTRS